MWYVDASGGALLPMFTATIARCTALMYAADFTVSTGYSAYAIWKEPARPGGPPGGLLTEKRLHRAGRAAAQHASRCVITWAAAAAGAAAVAALAPRESAGRWAGFGHIVVDVVVSNGVVFLLLSDNRAPAGSGGGGAAARPRPPPPHAAPELQLVPDVGGGGGGGGGGDGAGLDLGGGGADWGAQ
jgi:hypothetical protein